MSKARTISTVNKIESSLNSRLETDFGTVQTITDQTRDNVLASLNPSGNFLIDSSVHSKIDQIINLLASRRSDLEAYRNNLIQEQTQLASEIGSIIATYGTIPTNANIARRLLDAQTKETAVSAKIIQVNTSIGEIATNTPNRITEYEALKTEIDKLDTTRDLPAMKGNTYNAGADLMKPGMAAIGYSFYDKDGIEVNGGSAPTNYFVDIRLADGTTQNLRVDHLQVNGTGTIDITGITFQDRSGAAVVINQAYEFTVNPGAIVTLPGIGGGTNRFIHSKPLNIVRPNPNLMTSATRQTELNRYNSVGNIVEDAMDAEWFNHHEQLEKEAVFAGLKHSDGPKFDKLTAEQKEDLYRKIQANMRPLFARRASWAGRLLHHIDNYATFDPNNENFHAWITSDNHAFSKDPEINKNAANWRNNLHNTLEDQITAYYKHRFNRAYTDDADGNTFIKTQLTEYLTEQLENKQDNNTHQDVEADVHAINFRSRRRFGVFGRNDNNYMRFFSGMSSVDIGEQNVNIITDKGQEGVKYTMKIDVSGKNQISTTVKIGDKKERTYKAGNPMALMESILRNPDIPQGKTRMHIAYNVAKGMIQKAQEDDISLRYRNAAGHNMVIRMDGKNIVLDDEDDLTNHGGTNRRITETLFDYSLFEGTNSWENRNTLGRTVTPAPDNRNLRMGIDRITRHFNCAMGQLNDTYNESTQRRFLGIMRSNTSSDFPTSPWTSPIKKLLNCKTNTNFDFSTSVSHNGKSVQIERQKNTFILRMGDIELKGKDLGKLLNKRKGGIRLFDGIERDICGEIYKNMVEKLRTNSKIARSNFGVMDPMTRRMYILDEDGQLGYIRAEDARTERRNLRRMPGVNTVINGAIAGGLTAAGIAAGGAPFLTAALTLPNVHAAAAVSLPLAGAIAPGLAFTKDASRIFGTGYGTLEHPPVGRTICDEAETREVYKNPLLMGKLMKIMNLRLGQI